MAISRRSGRRTSPPVRRKPAELSAQQDAAQPSRASAARLLAIDALLDISGELPSNARHIGDERAAGWITEAHLDPNSIAATWGSLRQFTLHLQWRGDADALDTLLDAWAAEVRSARPGADSQASVEWPSRDIEAARIFRAHGLVPALTLAVHQHASAAPRQPNPADAVRDWAVRQAVPADLDQIMRLWMEHIRYPAGLDPATVRPSTEPAGRAMLGGLLGSQPWAWVAERDGELIGFLRGPRPQETTLGTPTSCQPANWLATLGVAADSRGGGVGAALVDTAHADFRRAGMAATLLHFTTLNPLSAPFWSRHGYRPLWSIWSAWPAGTLR